MEICFDKSRKLDRAEWLRLLGVEKRHFEQAETDEKMRASIERLTQQMDEAEALLYDAAKPCFVYKVLRKSSIAVQGQSWRSILRGASR